MPGRRSQEDKVQRDGQGVIALRAKAGHQSSKKLRIFFRFELFGVESQGRAARAYAWTHRRKQQRTHFGLVSGLKVVIRLKQPRCGLVVAADLATAENGEEQVAVAAGGHSTP